MKAWVLDDLKGIGQLRLTEIPNPRIQPGEVLFQVHYAALNPADRYLAERQYPAKPALPHILGRDGVGVVVDSGTAAHEVPQGARRMVLRGETGGNRPGTFAEYVAVPAESLVELPAGWSEREAAGAALVYLTAYQALTMWGPLPASAAVLINGASGGVGVAAIQLAGAMGHRVFALSRNPEKARKLVSLGALEVLDPQNPQWRQQLKAALKPKGVDLAVDNIGGKFLPEMIDTLGDQGRVSLVGRLAGPVPSFNTATLFFRRLRMGGVAVGAYTNQESRSAWRELLGFMTKINARPQVDSVFPFEELPQAFERLAEGPLGKVLLEVKRQPIL